MPNNFWNRFRNNQDQDRIAIEAQSAFKKANFVDQAVESRSQKTDVISVTQPKPVSIIDRTENNYTSSPINKGDQFTAYYNYFEHFNQLNQFQFDSSKETRIKNFRDIANGEETLDACIHEIVIACIASHNEKDLVKGELKGDYEEVVKNLIQEEIDEILSYFNFEERGEEIFRDFLVTGEFCAENVISYQKPHFGVMDIKILKPERLEPIYNNFENKDVGFFLYKKPNQVEEMKPQHMRMPSTALTYSSIPLSCGQVTYCNSGKWDSEEKYIIPHIHSGIKASRYFSFLEQAVTIDAIKNAPERMHFKIPVYDQPQHVAQKTIRNFAQSIKRKFGGDETGVVNSNYNTMSILENIYSGVDNNGQSVSIEQLQGSTAFSNGFNGILTHFHQKIYEDMHVPISRLNPDTTQSDGVTMTAQDLAFSRRVESIQNKIAMAIKKTVITHLKLKGIKLHEESCKASILLEKKEQGVEKHTFTPQEVLKKHLDLIENDYYEDRRQVLLESFDGDCDKVSETVGQSYWNQFDLKEKDIKIEFSLPTAFSALREQQMNEIRWNNFSNKVSNDLFSIEYAMKTDLGMSDKEILSNREWLKRETDFRWEINNRTETGPDFREQMAREAGIETGGGSSGGDFEPDFDPPSGGGSSGGSPDFGDGGGLDDLGNDSELDDIGSEEPLPDVDSEDSES